MYDPKAREVALSETVAASKIPLPATRSDKLDAGWRFVTVPSVDVYDHVFKGIGLNAKTFGPGTHLLPPDEASYLEDRLKVWNAAMVRMLRPTANAAALKAVNTQGSGAGMVSQAPEIDSI